MNPRLSIFCISAMAISMSLSMTMSGAVLAEIYQSTDADGNPVFTDSPDHSKDAKEIDLGHTNIADPLKERAHSSASGSQSSTPRAKQHEATIVVVPNSYNENLDAKQAADRREQVLHADEREEVLHADKRDKVLHADKREEMLEADRPNDAESESEDTVMPVTRHFPVQNKGGTMKPR